MELKFIKDLYEQSSEKAKANPAFQERMSYIDGYIELTTRGNMNSMIGYLGSKYSTSILPDGTIRVDIHYTHQEKERKEKLEKENTTDRTLKTFEIKTDDQGNLFFTENEGELRKNLETQNVYAPTKLETSYQITKYDPNGIVTQRSNAGHLLFHFDQLDINMPQFTEFKQYGDSCFSYIDSELKKQLDYRNPLGIEEQYHVITSRLRQFENNDFYLWEASRNGDGKTASVRETVVDNCQELTVLKEPNAPIYTSDLSIMRIDPPYGLKTNYSKEQIEEIRKEGAKPLR